MSDLIGLAVFSLVAAITPGPNNVMLWASGVQFGIKRTVPHLVGIVLGVGSMAVITATGLGTLIEAVPGMETGLKLTGSAYLLYLAVRISGITGFRRPEAAQPLTLFQGLAFQYVNPKAWVFVLGAIAAFRPRGLPLLAGSAVAATVMMLVVLPCASTWAAAGTLLNRFFTGDRPRRVLSAVLGALLVGTVAFIWI